jgi:enoyl-CoA hydratase
MTYENILTHTQDRVGVIEINRPKALNALDAPTMQEIVAALTAFDEDLAIGAIVIHGTDRAFAAGADIRQMAPATPVDMLNMTFIGYWDEVKSIAKPIIAAVSGYALGGGCELAMACDMIVASESARFGQPEINLGIIPGAGGTQRLTKALGKALAMEVCLGERMLSAEEAARHGLVNHVYPVETYLAQALSLAKTVANQAPVAARIAKAAINASYEMSLADGIEHERMLFYMLFATEDQKAGMQAFLNKQKKPDWKGQ